MEYEFEKVTLYINSIDLLERLEEDFNNSNYNTKTEYLKYLITLGLNSKNDMLKNEEINTYLKMIFKTIANTDLNVCKIMEALND